MSGLPTAPRSAVDIDYSTLPNNPPFVAHVANLSFEIDDDHLRRIFADLNVKNKFEQKKNFFFSVFFLAEISSYYARG
jgi:hypothetical protein